MLIVPDFLIKTGRGVHLGIYMVHDSIDERTGATRHQLSNMQGKDGVVIDNGLV